MSWENLGPDLSLTVENKMGNLYKIRLFKFQTMNEIFHNLKFLEFINELGKICFLLEKMKF